MKLTLSSLWSCDGLMDSAGNKVRGEARGAERSVLATCLSSWKRDNRNAFGKFINSNTVIRYTE